MYGVTGRRKSNEAHTVEQQPLPELCHQRNNFAAVIVIVIVIVIIIVMVIILVIIRILVLKYK